MIIGTTSILFLFFLMSRCAIATTQPAPNSVWDFSETHRIAQVPWPKDRAGSVFIPIELKGRARLKFDNGRAFDRYVDGIGFSRNGDQIVSVTFSLENQTVQAVYDTARGLAEDWSLPTAALDKWFTDVRAGRDDTLAVRRNTTVPNVSLEIVHTFNDERPYAIELMVGWREAPATRPTTRPTN